jgi:hypothetical protein
MEDTCSNDRTRAQSSRSHAHGKQQQQQQQQQYQQDQSYPPQNHMKRQLHINKSPSEFGFFLKATRACQCERPRIAHYSRGLYLYHRRKKTNTEQAGTSGLGCVEMLRCDDDVVRRVVWCGRGEPGGLLWSWEWVGETVSRWEVGVSQLKGRGGHFEEQRDSSRQDGSTYRGTGQPISGRCRILEEGLSVNVYRAHVSFLNSATRQRFPVPWQSFLGKASSRPRIEQGSGTSLRHRSTEKTNLCSTHQPAPSRCY